MDISPSNELNIMMHTVYFRQNLFAKMHKLYQSNDTNRMTLIFFAVSGLDLLQTLDDKHIDKKRIIDYIYSLQCVPDVTDKELNWKSIGFRGGHYGGEPYNNATNYHKRNYDSSHITMTYTALCSLKILGDDLKGVLKNEILRALSALQLENGSFITNEYGSENDLRFTYCAASICTILNGWTYINVDSAVKFIQDCQTYEGGYGLRIGQEAHGGSTYCAVASLALMNRLDAILDRDALVRWCVERQVHGFQGRTGKDPDCCYSFWIGATLQILGHTDLIDSTSIKSFTLSCACEEMGGFSKYPDGFPDILHAYMGLAGLSVIGHPQLRQLESMLNISKRAAGI